MKLRLVRALLGFSLLFALAPLHAAPPVDGEALDKRGRTLVGTWKVQITLTVCQTGAAIRDPFAAMATFNLGGTMTTSDGSLNPALRGAGHGVWERSGNDYRVVAEAFLFNAGGAWTGRQRLVQTIEVDEEGETFRANVAATVLDPGGNVVFTGCATSSGQRMQ
jgi:hypothetical protein